MTLLDYFAAQAMFGICVGNRVEGYNMQPASMAKTAYKIAQPDLTTRRGNE